jgi:DNA polymerase elongation subunit (family B)
MFLNSGYGVYGDSGFSYYDPRVAELITAYGRQALSKMQEIAKDLGFQVVYGDTDSLFLDSPAKESLSKFQDKFNRELDIELGIKNTYFNCILSKGKKHYIGYGVDDKNRKTFDIVGMEGKKSDRPKFVNSTFKQLVNDVVRDNVDPIPNLRRAMSDLDLNNVHQDLMKISKVLRENPEDYRSKTCQSRKIGNALGKTKGELIEYFVSNIKKTGSSWSTNPADIDVKWYKQSLWNTVKEVLEIAGYPVEDLANEFGLTCLLRDMVVTLFFGLLITLVETRVWLANKLGLLPLGIDIIFCGLLIFSCLRDLLTCYFYCSYIIIKLLLFLFKRRTKSFLYLDVHDCLLLL